MLALLAALAACERAARPPAIDSSRAAPPADTTAAPPAASSGWDRARFGAVLLIEGDDPSTALAVAPDSGRLPDLAGASATLLARAGGTERATLDARVEQLGEACAGYPGWHVKTAAAPAPWTFGLVGATARPIPLDTLAGMSRGDSARLTAEVTRLASMLPSAGGDRFQGLPFSVRSLARFAVKGADVVVAALIRQVNQEAQPLEERTMLVAERDSATGEWRTGYYERSSGQDETVETRDLLAAAYPSGGADPLLVVARDYGNAAAYSLLERVGGVWRLRWTSPRVHC